MDIPVYLSHSTALPLSFTVATLALVQHPPAAYSRLLDPVVNYVCGFVRIQSCITPCVHINTRGEYSMYSLLPRNASLPQPVHIEIIESNPDVSTP